ncbi:MAG TPA: transcription antitermination factor NusB [Acidimicrobiales bacterium]|nr:transcription antitermination factor NusB [Acidimicrobiales bacterium]
MSLAPTARGLALHALRQIDAGARANVVAPELLTHSRLDQRDRHLVTELVYGTCRMQRACDWLTGRHTRGRIDAEVRSALRLGAYQLGWTRIPPHAAVSATVAEVRGPGRSVVNAVLRKVAGDMEQGLVTWPNTATELSYPDWIVDRLTADLGRDRALAALRAMNEPASATVRADGYVQDAASQMVAAHLGRLVPGGTVLDMCAAPGGKATGLAPTAALVVAADVSVARSRVVAANAARLRAGGVVTVSADGSEPPFRAGRFDLVLVDAPCSGLGVLRRRPDARWRIQPGDVDRLVALQRRLLISASALLRPGGYLAYSVCTLTVAETAAVDRWAAQALAALAPVAPPGDPWGHAGRGALLLPQAEGTDGMFLLTLRSPR